MGNILKIIVLAFIPLLLPAQTGEFPIYFMRHHREVVQPLPPLPSDTITTFSCNTQLKCNDVLICNSELVLNIKKIDDLFKNEEYEEIDMALAYTDTDNK